MKIKLFVLILFLFLSFKTFSQSYLGITTAQGNLRETPDLNGNILDVLKINTQLFVYSAELTNDFYKVIDISNDQEGWIHKNLIRLAKALPKAQGGLFTSTGKNDNDYATISVTNNTSLSLTLKLNQKNYYFDPQESKTISLQAGTYEYLASAPSVLPAYGDEDFQVGNSYSWTFYVSSSYGSGGYSGGRTSKRRRR